MLYCGLRFRNNAFRKKQTHRQWRILNSKLRICHYSHLPKTLRYEKQIKTLNQRMTATLHSLSIEINEGRRFLSITNWNRACFAKLIGSRLQEGVNTKLDSVSKFKSWLPASPFTSADKTVLRQLTRKVTNCEGYLFAFCLSKEIRKERNLLFFLGRWTDPFWNLYSIFE
jgi:hypothetical protein